MRLWLALALACASATEPAPPPAPTPVPVPVPVPVPAPTPVPAPAPDLRNRPPEGWVDLAEHVPGLVLDIRYHTADNFTGAPLPGYGVPGAWFLRAPADALVQVQARLAEQGLGLKVFDAYRPLRGTLGMVAWAKRTDRVHLLDDGYVARRSGHNKGQTIDLTVIRLADGVELDMGTPWDTLSEASHTRAATGDALANRLLLKEAMESSGFKNYWKEWWHYSFAVEPDPPHRDVPYACFEAPEGRWQPPAGWDAPGFVMPAGFSPGPCVP